jgi:probable HAF family extracellular repeat protein
MRPLLFALLLSLVASICDPPRVRIIGESHTATGAIHAFLWDDREMVDLGSFGRTNSWA